MNTFLRDQLTAAQPRLVRRKDDENSWSFLSEGNPARIRLCETRYEDIELTFPYRALELFDECELHGLRFVVVAWRKQPIGREWDVQRMRYYLYFHWEYAVRVLPLFKA